MVGESEHNLKSAVKEYFNCLGIQPPIYKNITVLVQKPYCHRNLTTAINKHDKEGIPPSAIPGSAGNTAKTTTDTEGTENPQSKTTPVSPRSTLASGKTTDKPGEKGREPPKPQPTPTGSTTAADKTSRKPPAPPRPQANSSDSSSTDEKTDRKLQAPAKPHVSNVDKLGGTPKVPVRHKTLSTDASASTDSSNIPTHKPDVKVQTDKAADKFEGGENKDTAGDTPFFKHNYDTLLYTMDFYRDAISNIETKYKVRVKWQPLVERCTVFIIPRDGYSEKEANEAMKDFKNLVKVVDDSLSKRIFKIPCGVTIFSDAFQRAKSFLSVIDVKAILYATDGVYKILSTNDDKLDEAVKMIQKTLGYQTEPKTQMEDVPCLSSTPPSPSYKKDEISTNQSTLTKPIDKEYGLVKQASAGEDILHYIFHVYRVKLGQEENRKGIKYEWNGKGDVLIKPAKRNSKCTKDDLERVYDHFVTFVQKIHSSLISKDVDLQKENIASAIIGLARKDTHTKYSKIWIKELDNEKQYRFLGEAEEVKRAMETFYDYIGLATPTVRHHAKKRHGRQGAVQRSLSDDGTQPVDISLQFTAGHKARMTVTICKGDITTLNVEAIANAANSQLNHGGGVAGAIVKAGGYSIQEESYQIIRSRGGKQLSVSEVVYTKAGTLPCQWVLHTVGPEWKKYGRGARRALQNCCTNLISEANLLKVKSLAIPAIGTGIYGVPREICAEVMKDAVFDYLSKKQHADSLLEVYFVDVVQETVEAFTREFEKAAKEKQIPCYSKNADQQSSTDRSVRSLPGSESSVDGIQFGTSTVSGFVPSGAGYPARSTNPSGSFVQTMGQRFTPTTSLNMHGAVPKSSPKSSATSDPPISSSSSEIDGDDCSICLDTIDDPKTLPCKHTFCTGCIDQSEKIRGPSCPLCKEPYGVIYGDMPKGTMYDSTDRMKSVPGFQGSGVITITYSIPSGIQGKEHPSPGKGFTGAARTAYLPDTIEGREVLQLLRIAFDRRLTFTVGTSTTSGLTDIVTWNDIHHKTSLYGGPQRFGYPDPSYLSRVKDELAAKGVKLS